MRARTLFSLCAAMLTTLSGAAQTTDPAIEVRCEVSPQGHTSKFRIYQAGATTPFRGTLTEYHPNGKPKTEFKISDGLPDAMTIYYDNGKYDEKCAWLIMSFDGPFWGTKQPFEYYYPNGDQRALYGPRSIYTPFANDEYYAGFSEFRSREEIAAEELPFFLWDRLAATAEAGHAMTAYFLGYLYTSGVYVPKDNARSIGFYEMSAVRGFAPAQSALAIKYIAKDGSGRRLDHDKGVHWFTKAAEQGQVDAQYYLGALLYDTDIEQAADWYFRAAGQGDGRALYEVGVMYYLGTFVEKDLATAFEMFSKGDEAGHASCQNALGLMYLNGQHVGADREKAVQFFRKSARQGYEKAIKQLQDMGE